MTSKCRLAEANVACEFYHQARLRGLQPEMEAKLDSSHHRSGKMRADCVLRSGSAVLCAVEFKRYSGRRVRTDTRQWKAYDEQPFPVFYCRGFDAIDDTLDTITKLIPQELPYSSSMYIVREDKDSLRSLSS